MRTSRLEAFSDGVLAIIITIMVLELKVPEGPKLTYLVHTTGLGLLSYLLSFVYVGIYWNNHHHMFHVVRRVGGGVLWANLGLLLCLSLFPFTTAWVDNWPLAATPVVLYGVNFLAAALAYFILQMVIIRTEGPESALRRALGANYKGKFSPFVYLVGIVAALTLGRTGVVIALACYVAVAIMWIVPDRRIARLIDEFEEG